MILWMEEHDSKTEQPTRVSISFAFMFSIHGLRLGGLSGNAFNFHMCAYSASFLVHY